MQLYTKIIAFIKPYWKQLSAALVLTLLYVLFNNLSMWISVDFVKELFEPSAMEQQVGAASDSLTSAKKAPSATDLMDIAKKGSGLYYSVKSRINSVLVQDTREKTLLMVCLLIFVSFLFKNITFYGRRILLNYIQIKVIVNVRNQLHHKLIHLPLRFFEKRHTGELNSIVFNDVNAINLVLDTSFGKMILSPIQIAANVFILFMISWKLSLVTFIIIPLSAFVMTKIGQSIRRRSRRVYQQIADVTEKFQEAITGIRIVKAFANEPVEQSRFEASNHQYFKKTFRQNKMRYLTSPINETIYVTLLVFLLWYGGNMVFSHQGITADDFIRFLLFLFTMFQPLKDLSGVNNIIQTGLAAAERIFSILEIPEETYTPPNSTELKSFEREIEYRNVWFRYEPDEEDVLKDISFTIRKGEMVAVVGPSGAGKTTLANLLPRFYDARSGAVLIDGRDIRTFTLHSLRRQIGIVTQDTILFNDTIRQNIAYGLVGVAEADIINAAKAANAWEFIEKLPQGLDTWIGEKGTRLSGGQKQRISIARAILKNPSILILDEATSALDTESERLVQEAIDNLLQKRTVLVIAHRLSTIKNATRIIALNQGRIEGIGPHEELLRKSPTYKNLYENQLLQGQELADTVSG